MLAGLLCFLCSGLLTVAHARLIAIEQAHAELTVGGVSTAANVTLPYGWDYHHGGQSGVGRFDLAFDGPMSTDLPWALYFTRLGNAYTIRFNGVLLEQNGFLDEPDTSDFAKTPRFVHIPPNLLLSHNFLEVTIRSDSGRRSGMPRVWVGPKAELEPMYRGEFALRMGGAAVLMVFSLFVSVFAGVLWISQTDPRPERRGMRDNLYLFAAMAECCWALFISDTLIENPPLSWPWWSIAVNLTLGLWLAFLLLFCHSVAGWERRPWSRWVRRGLLALVLVGPAVAWGTASGNVPQLLTLWQAGFVLVFVPSTVLFVGQAIRKGTTTHRWVAAAFLINVPIGVLDFYSLRFGDGFANTALLRYSATLFGLVLGAIAIDRFRSANLRVRDLLDALASKVDDKGQELSQSHQRLDQLAREQERVQERARILRDMHDGVGSHISSAIRQLQSGHANHDEVLLTLRDSLDQLKLSIDALNLPPGDVTALLANMRYRLEPRFRSMGLALEWALVPLPELPYLDASAMRQLQYIFFEALSNVMQHAHASVLRIEATPVLATQGGVQHRVRIRICDNGRGFDTTAVRRKGLVSMQARALTIGAQVSVCSHPGETAVEILLA